MALRANEGLRSNVGLFDMKEFERPWSRASTNPLKHHNINPTAAQSGLFCPQELLLPWAKWLVQTEYFPLIKAQPHPTGQKYSVTCWPIHWLANTFPLQKSSSAHLRVLTYEREYTVEAPLWSYHFGELLLACKIKMLDDKVTIIYFLDVKVNTDWNRREIGPEELWHFSLVLSLLFALTKYSCSASHWSPMQSACHKTRPQSIGLFWWL